MKEVVNKEVALDELDLFINSNVKKPLDKDELEKTYPDVLDAIIDGYLSFDENGNPTYRLKQPVKAESGEVVLAEISNFQTRIKPTTLASLAKGLHPQHEVFTLQLRMTAYILGQSVGMLDKLGKYDYDVLSQLASVFN